MIKDKTRPRPSFKALRKEAERVLREQGPRQLDPEEVDLLSLTHELEVQQIELEMQNEDLHRANRELEASRTEYADLYESAPVPFVTVNEQDIIELDNHAATRLLGSGVSLVGLPFESLIHPEDRPLYHSCLKRVAHRLMPGSCVMRLNVSGLILHVMLEAAAKQDRDGALHWRLALVDITEGKRMEEALQKANYELESRVQERTAELKKMNERLQRSNKALQEFASIASHDLQEPLRKIQTFSDLLKNPREPLSEEQRDDYFERMQSAAERMRAMIEALLEYSRIKTRGESFTEINLSEIARRAIQILDLKVEETGARVHIADLPEVEASPSQMVQLFQNLIQNALKFQKKDTQPEVKIYSEQVVEDRIKLLVEDNGISFDEKYLIRIFNPFERLHGKGEFKGSGMGLAICKEIVERHGGTITAKSTPGKGSTFIIELPVKQTYPLQF